MLSEVTISFHRRSGDPHEEESGDDPSEIADARASGAQIQGRPCAAPSVDKTISMLRMNFVMLLNTQKS